MLGQFTRKHQTNSGLDLPGAQGSLLVVSGQLSSLRRNTFKDIINEGVHDGHTLLGDTSVGMDLFEDLVDVGRVGFDTLLGTLLVGGGGFFGCLGGSLLGGGLGHVGNRVVELCDRIGNSIYERFE